MLNTLNISGNSDDYVIYGSTTLYSPQKQQVNMFAGSPNAHKVWLNGEVVRDWKFRTRPTMVHV